MALFESYERREPQIMAVLKKYGIKSIEECLEVIPVRLLRVELRNAWKSARQRASTLTKSPKASRRFASRMQSGHIR